MYQKPALCLSVWTLFLESFRLYRYTFAHVIWFAILGAIVSAVPVMRFINEQDLILYSRTLNSLNWSYFLVQLIASLIVLWCYLAIIKQTWFVFRGQKPHSGLASLQGLIQLPSLFVFLCFYVLIFFVGLMLLIFPGIIFGVGCFLGIVLIGEGKKNPFMAFVQSYQLVWPRWWRGFFLLALPMCFIFLLGYLIDKCTISFFNASHYSAERMWILRSIMGMFLGVPFTSWFYGLNILLLNDLRLHRQPQVEETTTEDILQHQEEETLDTLEKNT